MELEEERGERKRGRGRKREWQSFERGKEILILQGA
jgi:hypothetical protein